MNGAPFARELDTVEGKIVVRVSDARVIVADETAAIWLTHQEAYRLAKLIEHAAESLEAYHV